jgi:hypothetical protein
MSTPIVLRIPQRVYNKTTKLVEDRLFDVTIHPTYIVDMLAQKAFESTSGRATVLRNSVVVKVVK